jgi:hypothetical protein
VDRLQLSPFTFSIIRTFEEGDPQQWMDVITGLREIWAQNSITVPTDMSNTIVALLKGASLTA